MENVFEEEKEFLNCLDTFSGISVRDDYSYETLKKYTKNEIDVVCDPTLLMDKFFYENFITAKGASTVSFSVLVWNNSQFSYATNTRNRKE